MGKLTERLRRDRDRRKDHRKGEGVPAPVPSVAAEPEPVENEHHPMVPGETVESTWGDSPVVIREKMHHAEPMTLDDALYEMELVGHDFFLFIDAETSLPSVAYRRRGWSYGVIRLDAPVAVTADAF